VGTIVSFHAHPDDESIGTAGTMARAVDAGHRVVVVFATRGELGEPVPGVLADGEQLSLRRSAECYAAARELGVHRVEFLGYTDSGMMGEPTNDAPYCFWRAPVEHAARRLAVILDEEEPDVLTAYDDIGGYGHPDHIQVHRVGMRAAELCAVPVVAQQTINRDWLERGRRRLVASGEVGADVWSPEDEPSTFGRPEAQITHKVEVVDVAGRKRAAMRAHASQMGPDHPLLAMNEPMFLAVLGVEFYVVTPPPDARPADRRRSAAGGATGPAAAPEVFHELFTPLR
jgi:LmbE family N-acetylglucosaminyl deacetylase